MISLTLTLNIEKLFHRLEAQRTIDFMVANKYLNQVAQKAYIEGINGCKEHVTVVQEMIQHAKLKHKTVHITWFDLEDAFGSVCHMGQCHQGVHLEAKYVLQMKF